MSRKVITAPTSPAAPVVSTWPVTTRFVFRVNDASTSGNEFGVKATFEGIYVDDVSVTNVATTTCQAAKVLVPR